MALSHATVALNSSTAVDLNANAIITDPVTGEKNYTWQSATVYVENVDTAATVYLGSSGVTSSNYGISLLPGASVSIDLLGGNENVWAISSGSSNVAVLLVTTA